MMYKSFKVPYPIHPSFIFVTTIYTIRHQIEIIQNKSCLFINQALHSEGSSYLFALRDWSRQEQMEGFQFFTCPVYLLFFNYYFPFYFYWKQLGQILLRGHKAGWWPHDRCFLEHRDLTPARQYWTVKLSIWTVKVYFEGIILYFNVVFQGSSLSAINTREQAIDQYKALLKKKKDLTRKNRAVQTKIAQYARKHKIDLTGNVDLAETLPEEDAKIYNNLLDQLKDITHKKATHDFSIQGQSQIVF